MIDLNSINIESANWAAGRIRELHPFPTSPRLAEMPQKDLSAWLRTFHVLVNDYVGVIGALRRPGRAWVDVQLATGKWVGLWIEDCPTIAAIECALWWDETVIAAGIGLEDSAQAKEAHQARLDSGDLLALLGDDW